MEREMAQATHPAYLIGQSTEALKMAHGKALGAAAIHQAGGRFYFAELCEGRAAEIMALLSDRLAKAA
jgi:hypothetical protein